MGQLKFTLITMLLLSAILETSAFAQMAGKSAAATDAFEMPENKVITRWYTAENNKAEKGLPFASDPHSRVVFGSSSLSIIR